MADAQEVQFFFLFLNFDMVVVIQLQENSATFGKLIEKWLEKLTRNNFLSNVFTFVAVLYRSEVSRQSLASRSSRLDSQFSKLSRIESRVSRIEFQGLRLEKLGTCRDSALFKNVQLTCFLKITSACIG